MEEAYNNNNNNLKQHLLVGLQEEEEAAPAADTASSSITPMLIIYSFIAVFGSLGCGYVVGFTSPIQSELKKDLNLSTAEYSLFGSLVNVGGLLGAALCGKITDYLGRRCAMGLADLFFITGWIFIAVAQNAWMLDVGRFMSGFASAIINYAYPIYVAEFAPKNLRGGFVVLHLLLLVAGVSIVYVIGLVIPWRILALLGTIPSLVQMFGFFFIPESPRWLMMMGRYKDFEVALQRFRGANANILEEAANIMECTKALEQMSEASLLQLFQKKYTYALTVGIGLSALSVLVGLNGVVSYARSIFESAGFSGTVGTIALSLIQVPSVGLGVVLLDKCGRRPLLMISAGALCLGCLLAGVSFVLQDHHLLKGFSPYFALVGILMYAAAYPIGVGGVTAVMIAEIFPLNIKGLAGSVTALVSCLLGGVVSYAFNFIMEWSSSGTFFIMAANCALTLIFAVVLVPETRGKTLEQIQMSISHVWQ